MKPIKRIETLKPLSRQHHEGLLMCFKLRQGLKKEISEDRIKAFIDFSYAKHLKDHFELEEEHIFPILDEDDEMRIKVVSQHRKLEDMIERNQMTMDEIKEFEQALNEHIRYEERHVFNKIQDLASLEQLKEIERLHIENPTYEDYEDVFWE